jgi:hypothetical protein
MLKITYDDGSILPEVFSPPAEPENDNFPVKARYQTPAEAIQTIQRWLREMRQEVAANFSLRADPEYRKRWNEMHAMEKCAFWVYYRLRKD